MPKWRRWCCLVFILPLLVARPLAAEEPVLRLGLVAFGTASWEIATLENPGVDLRVVELANPQAGRVALLGGGVDMILADWLWVSRQRDGGHGVTFLPWSSAVGGLLVPPGSPVTTLADLRGKRVGVAGGPLDKSWLLLKALAKRDHGMDLETATQVVHAAPPLLNRQAEAGELDAVLTFWHYGARLQAKGFRTVMDADAAAEALGAGGAVPWLGWAVTDAWAAAHPQALAAFHAATRRAKERLRDDDAAWDPLRPLMRADDEATFEALRAGYRAGIPGPLKAKQEAAAAHLFALLAATGGRDLVGEAKTLAAGTFAAVAEDAP